MVNSIRKKKREKTAEKKARSCKQKEASGIIGQSAYAQTLD
jgi:hypothetical protein